MSKTLLRLKVVHATSFTNKMLCWLIVSANVSVKTQSAKSCIGKNLCLEHDVSARCCVQQMLC